MQSATKSNPDASRDSMAVKTDNLRTRLAYFEEKLEEAKLNFAAKESAPKTFSASFTTDPLKTWPEVIAVIKSRIADISEQLRRSGIQA